MACKLVAFYGVLSKALAVDSGNIARCARELFTGSGPTQWYWPARP